MTFGNKYFNNLIVAMDKVNQKYLEELQRFESMGQDTLMADVLDMVCMILRLDQKSLIEPIMM